MKYQALTGLIIQQFYHVYNVLGYGFFERVYENALVHMLGVAEVPFVQQAPIKVYFRDVIVGDYVADLIVDERVICELKAVQKLEPVHTAQLLNYLRATDYEVGLLLNFGPQPQVVRKVLDNSLKPHVRWNRFQDDL